MIASQERVAKTMEEVFARCSRLRSAGQQEYALDSNALSNFVKLADELDTTPETVLWVYAMKHKDGIAAYIRGHRSQRENVSGRIGDLITYLCLLQVMVDINEESEKTP